MGSTAWLGAAIGLGVLVGAAVAGEGVLRVGRSEDYPPFTVGEEGFEVEVAKKLAADLGYRLEWVRFRWPELGERLRRGDFDVAMSGVTWTPERSLVGWTTYPVARTAPCLAGHPSARRVAVNRGGALERWVRRELPGVEIVAMEDNRRLFSALQQGEVEAVATDLFEARAQALPGTPLRCEPRRQRKVYWIGPRAGRSLGPRIDEWLVANEEWLSRLRRERLGVEERIDPLDRAIDLLARRLETMPLVAAAKRRRGLEIADPARESAVLDAAAAEARNAGLEPESVRSFWRSLIALCRRVQERSATSEPEYDLETELRPALSALDQRLVRALAKAAPAARGTWPSTRFEALRATLEPAEIEELATALGGIRELAPADGSGPDAGRGGDLLLGRSGLRLLGRQPTRIVVGTGVFDPSGTGSREGDRAGAAAGFQIELRSGPRLFWVAPVVGALANSKGGAMGYLGATTEIGLGRWVAAPLLALGAYEEGEGKRLGGVFEFQVGGTLSYEFSGGTRLGVTFAHISNADIHQENPGTEFLLFAASVPVPW